MIKVKTIEINLNQEESELHHKCQSKLEGEWIVYTCSRCPRYKRKINQHTDQMISEGIDVTNMHIQHSGQFMGVDPKDMN